MEIEEYKAVLLKTLDVLQKKLEGSEPEFSPGIVNSILLVADRLNSLTKKLDV